MAAEQREYTIKVRWYDENPEVCDVNVKTSKLLEGEEFVANLYYGEKKEPIGSSVVTSPGWAYFHGISKKECGEKPDREKFLVSFDPVIKAQNDTHVEVPAPNESVTEPESKSLNEKPERKVLKNAELKRANLKKAEPKREERKDRRKSERRKSETDTAVGKIAEKAKPEGVLSSVHEMQRVWSSRLPKPEGGSR